MIKLRKLAALVVLSLSSFALAAPRNPAQEAAIDEEVSAVDAALVQTVHEGNAAMDRGDASAAVRAYATVHDKAPNAVAITRRLCTAEWRAGDSAGAVRHCREAVKQQPDSAENHAALALALLSSAEATPEELGDARREANAAETIAPNTELSQAPTCAVALRLGDTTTLTICSAKLKKLAPSSPQTHVYAAAVLSSDGDIAGARRELDLARAAGLEESAYARMRDDLDKKAPPPGPREKIATAVSTAAPIVLGVWAAIVFLLLVLGMLLSDAAMGEPSRITRAIYRFVILVAVAMFYVSAALGVVVLVAAVGLLALLFLGLIGASRPVEIAFAVVGAYLFFAMLRALFERVPPVELGEPDRSKKSALRTTLDALTKRLRMPPIDAIYVVPGATIEVRELGGVFGHLRGTNERALVVGAFALGGLGTRAFGAVVTSELLRYRAEGSAGGDLAIIERDAIEALAERMEARGVATIANPAWWLVAIYRTFFERITEGAVEHQEKMADARAAKVYGSESLVAGLRHLAERSVEIEARAAAAIDDALDGEAPEDVYARNPAADIRAAIDATLEDLAERQAQIETLKENGYDEEEEAEAWSLFEDREEIEHAMNERLRAAMRERIGLREDDQASSESTVARA